jgi:hypothetical protein
MGPGGGKGRAALILAFGKARGKKPDGERTDDETGKEARLSMARQMITAMKEGDAEGLKVALEDFIASS